MCAFTQIASAQTVMSDEEVMKFVLEEHAKGPSQNEIISGLMKKGVSLEQIQRLQAKSNKQNDGSLMGAKDLTGKSRFRVNRRINKSELKGQSMRKEQDVDLNDLSPAERKKYLQYQKGHVS